MTEKKLINDKTLDLYLKRLEKIKELGYSEKGDEEFIANLTAVSEQVDNLHVKAEVNGFEIECDEPKSIGGTEKAPNPLETLLASMANCLELTAMMFFSFMKLDVNGVKVQVNASYDKRSLMLQRGNSLPGLYDIAYTWYIDTSEKRKTIERVLNQIEESCPVKWTLQKDHDFSQEIILNNQADN